MNIQERFSVLRSFFIECKRVLTVTRKPSNQEYKTIVTVSGIGIVVIGLIGFLLQLFVKLAFR